MGRRRSATAARVALSAAATVLAVKPALAAEPVPFVWTGGATPSFEATRALAEWAKVRGVTLEGPVPSRVPTLAIDWSIVDRVEDDLHRAREAMAVSDEAATDRALSRAEADLLAHPELPQAAWLLAEVERGWAARAVRMAPADEGRAAQAWARAEALDGGRLAGASEVPGAVAARAASAAGRILSELVLADTSLEVWLDGGRLDRQSLAHVERPPGRHQIVLRRQGGDPIFAAWVTFAPGAVLRFPASSRAPCSTEDLAGVPAAVQCGSWIAAETTAEPSIVRVARCATGRCEAFREWRAAGRGWHFPPADPHANDSRFRWPAWATWTLVGAGALAIGGVALGVALQPARVETRFVNGGLKVE